ncbi:MAG: hypothetical protein GX625_07120 [Clostridiaceae bacterium]|nr:hypothetical protein [Clostridiaceae bacterium]
MRELKFRAWDKSQKYMAYQGSPDLETLSSFMFHFGEDIVLQSTGFFDKNENEIFEGDILSDWNEVDGKQVQSFLQVFWCNSDGAWKLDSSFNQDKSSGDLLSEELSSFVYEISGNIYENPELLQRSF